MVSGVRPRLYPSRELYPWLIRFSEEVERSVERLSLRSLDRGHGKSRFLLDLARAKRRRAPRLHPTKGYRGAHKHFRGGSR